MDDEAAALKVRLHRARVPEFVDTCLQARMEQRLEVLKVSVMAA